MSKATLRVHPKFIKLWFDNAPARALGLPIGSTTGMAQAYLRHMLGPVAPDSEAFDRADLRQLKQVHSHSEIRCVLLNCCSTANSVCTRELSMKKNLLCLGVVLLFLGTVAHAGEIVTCTKNCPQGNEKNILFTTSQIGTLVLGYTNQTNAQVDFSSTTDTLNTPAKGQAMLTATDGDINNLSITVPNHSFGDFIFDAETGQLSKTGSLTLTADALTANQVLEIVNLGTFSLSSGSNFFTITSSGGWTI